MRKRFDRGPARPAHAPVVAAVGARNRRGGGRSKARSGTEITPPRQPAAEHWAKFEIRSPLDGIILERNVTIGDLVGVGADMFKIGDLTTLGVMANLYEEDLPLVESLPATSAAGPCMSPRASKPPASRADSR